MPCTMATSSRSFTPWEEGEYRRLGGTAAPIVSEHEARLDTLKKQLDELLRRYTDEHPDVVSTRRIGVRSAAGSTIAL